MGLRFSCVFEKLRWRKHTTYRWNNIIRFSKLSSTGRSDVDENLKMFKLDVFCTDFLKKLRLTVLNSNQAESLL